MGYIEWEHRGADGIWVRGEDGAWVPGVTPAAPVQTKRFLVQCAHERAGWPGPKGIYRDTLEEAEAACAERNADDRENPGCKPWLSVVAS